MGRRIRRQPFFRYLRTAAGSEVLNVNGSVTPVEFSVAPASIPLPAGAEALSIAVHQLVVSYLRSTNPGSLFTYDEYATVGAALTNGVELDVVRAGAVVVDLLDGLMVKRNHQWVRGGFLPAGDWDGRNNTAAVVAATFALDFGRAFGGPLELHADVDDALRLTIADDLSAEGDHRALAMGVVTYVDG